MVWPTNYNFMDQILHVYSMHAFYFVNHTMHNRAHYHCPSHDFVLIVQNKFILLRETYRFEPPPPSKRRLLEVYDLSEVNKAHI